MVLSIPTQRHIAKRTRAVLAERFPLTFLPKGERKKPLKLRIFYDLRAKCPDIPYYNLKLALGDYCRGPSYQSAMTHGADRIDLDGQPAGVVTAEVAAHSKANFDQLPELIRARWALPEAA